MANPTLSATRFMQELPDEVRASLPEELQSFEWRAHGALCQIYYEDPAFHYEVWCLRRLERLELGLHFESRNRTHNALLLEHFQSHIIEVKAKLGENVEAEPWDRGWSKVYQTILLEAYTQAYLRKTARQLAHMITVLEPILRLGLESLPLPFRQGGNEPRMN